jgi:RHS repeat-associated protein
MRRDNLKTYLSIYQMPDALNAFGMVMPERSFSNEKYRYGFNGMESNLELGETYTTEFRQLDVRLCRWLSSDPEANQFPGRSVYLMMGNSPVRIVDPLGNTDYIFDASGRLTHVAYNNTEDRYFNTTTQETQTHTTVTGEKETLYLSQITKPDFQIVQIHIDASSIIGHTGIGFDGKVHSFYPTDKNNDRAYTASDLFNSALEMHTADLSSFQEKYMKGDVYFVKVTNEQMAALSESLSNKQDLISDAKSKNNPVMYDLLSNNCTTNACDVLEQANVFSGSQLNGVMRPGNLDSFMNSSPDGLVGSDPSNSSFISPHSIIGQKKQP